MTWPRWLLAVTVVIVSLATADAAEAAARKNVVLIVADDMGTTLGCYGDRVVKTPHLDRLAAAGTRFTHAFCTTASCSPSRSVILTGMHGHTNGQYGLEHAAHAQQTHNWVRSLPVLLSAAGYRTCSIGKIHVGPAAVYKFDETANEGIAGARNPVRMAENARRFISQAADKPFFLYFCGTDPHRGGKPPESFANGPKYAGVVETTYDPAAIVVPPFLPDQPEVRRELAAYAQAVSRFDQGVGRLLDVLQETGHGDDTLVIFLSDNGIPFPGAKTTIYEPGLRLPLIVRTPGKRAPGGVCQAMVSWVDIAPTILEFTGVAGPNYALAGRSFLKAMEQEQPAGWDTVFASHNFHEITMYYPMRAIRTRKYKCILNLASELSFPFASDLHESLTWQGVLRRKDERFGRRATKDFLHRPRYELYDLEADPEETRNLSNDPAHAATLADLQRRLREFQQQTKDPWLVKYQYE